MNLIFKAAKEITEFFDSFRWSFCIIGGLANQCHGEPRTTHDVDLTLLTGVGSEQYYAEKILGHFKARIDHALNFRLKTVFFLSNHLMEFRLIFLLGHYRLKKK
jgi:hypothetical protein